MKNYFHNNMTVESYKLWFQLDSETFNFSMKNNKKIYSAILQFVKDYKIPILSLTVGGLWLLYSQNKK